jgi:hypothetical protein
VSNGNGWEPMDTATKQQPTKKSVNEILFEDRDGKQVVHLQAAKDLFVNSGRHAFRRAYDFSGDFARVSYASADDHVTCAERYVRCVERSCLESLGHYYHGSAAHYRFDGAIIYTIDSSALIMLQCGSSRIRMDYGMLTLQCGSCSIRMDGHAIWINAPWVHINDPGNQPKPKEPEGKAPELQTGRDEAEEQARRWGNLISELLEKVDPLSPAKNPADALRDILNSVLAGLNQTHAPDGGAASPSGSASSSKPSESPPPNVPLPPPL